MLLAENLQEQKYVQSRFTDRMLEEEAKKRNRNNNKWIWIVRRTYSI